MEGYWITFTDGSSGYCEGLSPYHAVQIAEKLSGKKVNIPDADKWKTNVQTLPYPATPVIWQFDDPVNGKCPAFCHDPKNCKGRTACPKNYACSE